ncbi:anthranilate synthase component II [bacterium endosymbiont of Pedicinus badii]|uniref:anthranilate synthase component II n=1 Tax=bacterium endosymbiont of Pedicinus badii TaxID=1719126 RepID=UPI0009B9DFA3|nr:aminodeoxychorismate/anthranilate synthase component II [bacterium endosymbiont of Pedicinus badii]OQM34095.1 hypothetical protein AOQ89_01995 [bacterium endosymbiont of Pedicinus badii]
MKENILKKKILIIDNYDSFTWNIYQYIKIFCKKVFVFYNDKIDIKKIRKINPNSIIISPGPGIPKDSGVCKKIMKNFHKKIPILGVCLGHQIIGEFFGAKLKNSPIIMHGKTSILFRKKSKIFYKIPNKILVNRYHSYVVSLKKFPNCLKIIAHTKSKRNLEIMAIEHKKFPVYGVQFHPESIFTEFGKEILYNFLSI